MLKSIKKSVGRDEGLGLLLHLLALPLASSPDVSGDALSGTPDDLLCVPRQVLPPPPAPAPGFRFPPAELSGGLVLEHPFSTRVIRICQSRRVRGSCCCRGTALFAALPSHQVCLGSFLGWLCGQMTQRGSASSGERVSRVNFT